MTDNLSSHSLMDSEAIRQQVVELISSFESQLKSENLRSKVLALASVFTTLRDLGKSLVPSNNISARERILYYFRRYSNTVIGGSELLVVSGIQEYARRVRELRVEFGWSIASGVTLKEISEAEGEDFSAEYRKMRPDDYILLDSEPDKEAAYRWHLANTIRNENISVQNKILKFLRKNVGQGVTGEELRYVAKDKTEWARRVRELRTECGWPIATRATSRPDLNVGVYVLQSDHQSFEHDRRISDDIRVRVLSRDHYKCTMCRWSNAMWNPTDPRFLELHHIQHHSKGGANTDDNLQTLCTVCHDIRHQME